MIFQALTKSTVSASLLNTWKSFDQISCFNSRDFGVLHVYSWAKKVYLKGNLSLVVIRGIRVKIFFENKGLSTNYGKNRQIIGGLLHRHKHDRSFSK